MNDLIKIGTLGDGEKTTAVIFRSGMRGTFHVYDSVGAYVCAEFEDKKSFDSYLRSKRRKGLTANITVNIEEPKTVLLRVPDDDWTILKETCEAESRSGVLNPELRAKIGKALSSVQDVSAKYQ